MTTVITPFELLSLNPQTPSKMIRVEYSEKPKVYKFFRIEGSRENRQKEKKGKKREIGKWICSQTQHKVVAFLDFVHLQAV